VSFPVDLLIGATALVYDLTVVTHNTRTFSAHPQSSAGGLAHAVSLGGAGILPLGAKSAGSPGRRWPGNGGSFV
jgi:hypothetical protein